MSTQKASTFSPSNILLIVAIFLFAAVALGYSYMHLGIYPKAEFRNWIAIPIDGIGGLIDAYKTHPSRAFAFSYMRMTGEVCGTNWPCLNFMNGAVPLVGSAIFIVLVVKSFTKSYTIPLLVATFFLVSYPTLSGWTWQPTALDKFATFFGMALLFYTHRVFSRDYNDIKSVIFYNILFSLIIVFGMGAKEIFWPILASIAFIFFASLIEDKNNWKKLRFFVLPAIFVALISGRMFYRMLVENYLMTEHNTGGDPLSNLSILARMFFNHPHHVNVPEPITWLAILGSLIGGVAIIIKSKKHWIDKGLIAALMFAFIVGVSLTSVTSGNAPFYYIALIAIFFMLFGICLTQLEGKPILHMAFSVALILGIIKSVDYSGRFIARDNVLSDNISATMLEIFDSTCDYENELPIVVDQGFNHAGVFINGTWCSHERVVRNQTSRTCGPRSSNKINYKRAVNKNYTFPDRYLYLDKDLKIAKLVCE